MTFLFKETKTFLVKMIVYSGIFQEAFEKIHSLFLLCFDSQSFPKFIKSSQEGSCLVFQGLHFL